MESPCSLVHIAALYFIALRDAPNKTGLNVINSNVMELLKMPHTLKKMK